MRYDYGAYLVLQDYCEKEPTIVIETNFGLRCTLVHGYVLPYAPNSIALYGDIEGPECEYKDHATIYPNGDTHVARSTKTGYYYIEPGTAYIEWTK